MTFDNFLIRQVTMEDAEGYYDLVERNRKRLERFFAGTVALTQTFEATKVHLADVIAKAAKNNYFPFIVVDINTNAIIGSIQIKSIDWSIPKGEIGYYIDTDWEGKGIISKAVAKVIDFGFNEMKFTKLYIRTNEHNIASVRIAQKNGFQLEGTLRREYKATDGEIIDVMYLGRLREDVI